MKRTVLAVTCACAAAMVTTSAQQQTTPQQPPQQQSQQQMPERQVTLTGCVYQATDQPTMFALQRIADAGAAGDRAEAGAATQPPGATTGKPDPTGTPGAPGQPTTGGVTRQAEPSTPGRGDVGAWYQLSGDTATDLKQYAGRAVRITGTLVPGKDEKGADVIIHRVTPQATAVTAIDLKPAPQLKIQQITPAQGQCQMKPQQ